MTDDIVTTIDLRSECYRPTSRRRGKIQAWTFSWCS